MSDAASGGGPAGPDDADEALRRAVSAGPAASPGEDARIEEGPRRTRLAVLATVAGAFLLWSLFRSVPGEPAGDAPGSADAARARGEVERMATESDPAWMRVPDPARVPDASDGPPVPPVYDAEPVGGAAGADDPLPAAPVAAPTSSNASLSGAPPDDGAHGEADPRRTAYLAALRSRPLAGGAGTGAATDPERAAGHAEAILPPPDLAELEATAHAEAERRSLPPADEGAFSAGPRRGDTRPGAAAGGPAAALPIAPAHEMAPRAALHGGGRLLVPAGTVIEGQLHTTLRSDLPGHAVGTVTQSVYDASQRVVVIPRQSWLLGTYDSDVVNGQARLAVQWTVIRFPDGRSYDLPALRASDRSGASGLAGRVDRHHRAVFGQALLSSLIAAGFQLGVPDAEEDGERSPAAEAAAITAQQLGQTAAEVTRRNLGLKPTIVVPRLTRFTILLDRDLVFLPRTSR